MTVDINFNDERKASTGTKRAGKKYIHSKKFGRKSFFWHLFICSCVMDDLVSQRIEKRQS